MKKRFQYINHRWLIGVAFMMASMGFSQVSADSAMWGVSADGTGTVYFKAEGQDWQAIQDTARPFVLSRLAPTDDSLWALDQEGKVWYKDVAPTDPTGSKTPWEQIVFPGKATDISAASEQVLVVDDQTNFFSKKVSASNPKGEDWVAIPEPIPFMQVNVTASTETLESIALSKAEDAAIKAYLAAIAAGKSPEEAKRLAEAAAREAALASGMSPEKAALFAQQAVISGMTSPEVTQAQVMAQTGATGAELLAKIAATGEEFVGAVSATHEFFVYSTKKKQWREIAEDLGFDDLPGSAERIDINDDGLAVGVNEVNQGFFRSNIEPQEDWTLIKDRSFSELLVNNNDMVWGLDKTGVVSAANVLDREKWDGTGFKEIATPKPFAHITITDKDAWGVSADGDVFYRLGITSQNPFGTDWQQVDEGKADRIKVIASDRSGKYVWGLSLLGEILYREGVTLSNPLGTNWIKVPGTLESIMVTSKGEPYGVDKDGALYTRTNVTEQTPMGTAWVGLLEETEAAAPLLKSIFISEVKLPLEGQLGKPKPATLENKKKAEKKREARKNKRNKTKKSRKLQKDKKAKEKKLKKKGKKGKKGKKTKKSKVARKAKKAQKIKQAKKTKGAQVKKAKKAKKKQPGEKKPGAKKKKKKGKKKKKQTAIATTVTVEAPAAEAAPAVAEAQAVEVTSTAEAPAVEATPVAAEVPVEAPTTEAAPTTAETPGA